MVQKTPICTYVGFTESWNICFFCWRNLTLKRSWNFVIIFYIMCTSFHMQNIWQAGSFCASFLRLCHSGSDSYRPPAHWEQLSELWGGHGLAVLKGKFSAFCVLNFCSDHLLRPWLTVCGARLQTYLYCQPPGLWPITTGCRGNWSVSTKRASILSKELPEPPTEPDQPPAYSYHRGA